jgi:ribokinase
MPAVPKITVVGSYNTDLVIRTPRIPQKGETILGGPFFSGPGGKGANQAVAAARLGAEVAMVVKLGNDQFGDLALMNLKNEGINCEYVIRTDESHTGVAFIIVDDAGENVIVVASGTNYLLSPVDIDFARSAITQADVVLFQLESPIDTVKYALEMAHLAGVKVLLNPAPGRPLDAEILSMVDILTPNQSETEILTQLPAATLEQASAALDALLTAGIKTAVLTMGAQGALLATPENKTVLPAYTVDVMDTTGAGDAFNGALAVAIAEGQTLEDAVCFANAAAALQVTRQGTASAMPVRREVEEFISRGN